MGLKNEKANIDVDDVCDIINLDLIPYFRERKDWDPHTLAAPALCFSVSMATAHRYLQKLHYRFDETSKKIFHDGILK